MTVYQSLMSFNLACLAWQKGFAIQSVGSHVYNYYEKSGGRGCISWSHLHTKDPVEAPLDLLQKWLQDEHKVRVFIENKVAGDFGFVIHTVNPEPEKIAGAPWIRHSHFTQHFPTYEDALIKGLEEGLKFLPDLHEIPFNMKSRCCGRCIGVGNDICIADQTCTPHNTVGCQECWPLYEEI